MGSIASVVIQSFLRNDKKLLLLLIGAAAALICNQIIRAPPKPFELESQIEKVKNVFKWIFGDSYKHNFLGGRISVSINDNLETMNNRGYVRFRNMDFSIMNEYLSGVSMRNISRFMDVHKNELYVCPHCNNDIQNGQKKWECASCLMHFHSKCMKKIEVIIEDSSYIFCRNCFFQV